MKGGEVKTSTELLVWTKCQATGARYRVNGTGHVRLETVHIKLQFVHPHWHSFVLTISSARLRAPKTGIRISSHFAISHTPTYSKETILCTSLAATIAA